jgi:YD repeat-containing protein
MKNKFHLFFLPFLLLPFSVSAQDVFTRNLSKEKMKANHVRTSTITYWDGRKNVDFYDQNGNVILSKLYGDPHDKIEDTTYIYYTYKNDSLLLQNKMVWPAYIHAPRIHDTYDYYDNGKLKEHVDSTWNIRTTYAYDSLGRISFTTEYKGDSKVVSAYSYDDQGRLICIRHLDPKIDVTTYITIDDKGNVTKTYDGTSLCTSEIIYKYSENKTEEIHYTCEGHKISYTITTIYDPKTRTEKETDESGKSVINSYNEHVFDEHGLLILVGAGHNDDTPTKITYTYW